ncbi:Reverse transcriptase (RNA-dependent DNA polymerase) [Fragilaria crotonensis]|nr:Reverse transcriptase (RNA-dependent DNA polymerase) [Fragilaria crotonensis]
MVGFRILRQGLVYDQKKIEIDGSGRRLARWLRLLIGSAATSVIGSSSNPDEYTNIGVSYTNDKDYDDMNVPDAMEADDLDNEITDKYLNAELIFDVGTGSERKGHVVKRAKGTSGEPIGRAHTNPLFDTRENGNRIPKVTTRGWSLLVTWKDGSSDWIPLKDIKDSYPVQIAEYAVTNNIAHEPAFNWWVHTVLRKRNRIVAKVKRYWRTTHKFGIRLPKSVEEALAIDEETGTDYWRKALGKAMSKVKVAWKPMDGVTPTQARTGKEPGLIGFQEIRCHIIFDIKMDFTRKARFVAGGHTTDTPGSLTYSSVVSQDSVRLAFLIARLNDLDVLAGDVTNAYLNAACREKIWFEGGLETGADQGKVLIVTRALYGLKSSGAAWRADLAATLRDLNFTSTKADPNGWIRSADTHYNMVLVYVDDILIFAKDPKVTMNELGKLETRKW